MTLRSGLAAQWGVGVESTWGTAVTATRFFPLLEESMEADKGRNDSDSIYAGRRVRDSEQWDEAEITAGGDVQVEMYLQGMGIILEHMLGTVVTTGAGPYVHTATPGSLDAKSLTVEVGKPGRGGVVHPWAFSGSKVASWELAAAVGEAATLGLTFSSETAERGGALASWSPAAGLQRLMWHHATVATVHGNSPNVRSISFSGDNALEDDRLFLGSQTIAEQDEVDLRTYEGEVECEFEDETLFDAFWDGDEGTIQLTLVRGTYSLDVSCNARLDPGASPTVDGRGKLSQSIPFTCIGDGTDADALTMVLTNGDAAA